MQIESPRRHHATAAEKMRILEACEHTDLTRQEFAAQEGIALSTLYQWRRQSRRRRAQGRPGWIEVPNLLGNGPGSAPYRLHLSGGRILEVSRGFDPGEVGLLLQLVQSL
jgi:hypothetical protein